MGQYRFSFLFPFFRSLCNETHDGLLQMKDSIIKPLDCGINGLEPNSKCNHPCGQRFRGEQAVALKLSQKCDFQLQFIWTDQKYCQFPDRHEPQSPGPSFPLAHPVPCALSFSLHSPFPSIFPSLFPPPFFLERLLLLSRRLSSVLYRFPIEVRQCIAKLSLPDSRSSLKKSFDRIRHCELATGKSFVDHRDRIRSQSLLGTVQRLRPSLMVSAE